jgi:serine/threonine protein kinase
MRETVGDSTQDVGRGQRRVPPGYELIQQIGRGATAVVSKARETATGADVALKIWLAPLDAAGRQRFEREVAILRRLTGNPNVVGLHAADAGDNVTPGWMATELFEESLADRLSRGPVAVSEAYWIADGILAGLDAIHRHGHLHRDVKPANVLLGDGRVVLCDLGIIATVVSETEHAGAGTVVAPELRLPDQQPSVRSDVFSAANTLLQLFGRDVPEALGDVLVRASSSRPSDRPPDVATLRRQIAATSTFPGEMASAAVSSIAAGQRGAEPPEDRPRPSGRFTRRARIAAGGLGVLLIAVASVHDIWDHTRATSDRSDATAGSSKGDPSGADLSTPGTTNTTAGGSPTATGPAPSPTLIHGGVRPTRTPPGSNPGPAGTSGRPATTKPVPKAPSWTNPVTLTVAPGNQVSVSAVVNEAPPPGRSYWLVIELFYPDTEDVEFYARWHLPSNTGKAGPKTITFEGGADLTYHRTAQVVSAAATAARQFQDQLDSPQADTDPLTQLPCSDCTVSKIVTITPR